MLGSLKPHHTSHVLNYFDRYRGWPNEQSFIEALISNFDSTAVYCVDDLDYPVAWSIQYPFGKMGGLYALDKFRKRNLGLLVAQEMVRTTRARGFLPWSALRVENTIMRTVSAKFGGLESNYTVKRLKLE